MIAFEYPKEIVVKIQKSQVKCAFLGLLVDEKHPEEFRYCKVRVKVLQKPQDDWVDETMVVRLTQVQRMDKQSIGRAWARDREMKNLEKNPALAVLMQ